MNKITQGLFRKKSKTTIEGLLVLFEGQLQSLVFTILFLALANAVDAQTTATRFNDGFLSVFKVTSSTALTNSGTAVVVEEYASIGSSQTSPNYNVALPTASGNKIVVSGSATAAGQISRSENGRYIVVPGYDALVGDANSTFNTNATLRTVNGDGTVGAGVVASSVLWLSGNNNVRGGTSDDGTNFWVSGNGMGIQNVTAPNSPITVSTTSTNNRACYIYNGQLYLTTGAGTQGIYSVGTSKPLTSGNTATRLFAPTNTDVYGFSISPDGKTIYYVAATTGSAAGLYRSTNSGSSWTTGNQINTAAGLTGIAVDWADYTFNVSSANGAKIYTSNPTTVNLINDNGASTVTATVLRTISGNNAFRGLAFSPIKQTLSLGTNSPTASNVSTNATNAPLFQFSLSADEGNSTLKKLILTQNGTASIGFGNSISNFRLIEDLDGNGLASASEISAALAAGVVASNTINFSVPINTSNYIQQGNSRDYIIIGDVSFTGSGTFIPSIVSTNTINSVAYTSNLVNAGGSLVTIGTNAPTGNTITITSAATNWTGLTNSSWTNPGNWTAGVPNQNSDVWALGSPNAPVISSNVNINSLRIDGTTLTVSSGSNLTITNGILNQTGTLVIENNANLIQVNTVSNYGAGSTIVNRTSNFLTRNEYTIWSSPVFGQNLLAFSPVTLPTRFYNYNESTNLYNVVAGVASVSFSQGAGYLIRMPDSNVLANYNTGGASMNYPGVFTGTVNNGNISKLMEYTGPTFGYNLVGNPYPSTIDANAFISANTANIESTLYFWRKVNGAQGTAYASYNSLGPVAAGSGISETGSEAPNGTIQVGQGFFVKAKSATDLIFTNTMRVANNANQFFKTKQVVQKDRVWLNLTNITGVFSQALIGYTADATVGLDIYDGKYINDSPIALTSNIGNQEYTIQGRPAFDASDVVALNFKTDVAGDYTIAIDHVDGLFSGSQDIYLVDSKTGAETNLKTGSYAFTATAGVDNSRFSLKYQKTLSLDAQAFTDNSVIVYKKNDVIFVNAGAKTINNIKVFDIQGRVLAERNNVKANTTSIQNLSASNQIVIVKVTTEDNQVISKKVEN